MFVLFSFAECSNAFNLNNGVCVSICPPKNFYYLKMLKCLPCHYTCMECIGPLDYQCTKCYSDSILYKLSDSESYCYRLNQFHAIQEHIWFYRIFKGVVVLLVVLIIISIYLFIKWKRRVSEKYRYEKLSTEESIRALERKIKSDYCDSE